MVNLATLLERELADAFEVKNRKSLRRYVLILTENLVKRQNYRDDIGALKSDVRVIAETMKQGFASTDKRFEDMSLRFEDLSKRAANGFTYMNVILGILVLITVLFKFI